jgi:hypothetical protein
MPIIARFYGIVIKMFYNEHGVPHFHAVYCEYNAVYEIKGIEMIEGDLPIRAQRLVREWAEENKEELLKMWETKSFHKLPSLK